jgi:hypothetical protein
MQKENSKYRRMLKRLPADLKQLLGKLKKPYRVEHCTTDGRGWIAVIDIETQKISIASEYGRLFLSFEQEGRNPEHSLPDYRQNGFSIVEAANLLNAK